MTSPEADPERLPSTEARRAIRIFGVVFAALAPAVLYVAGMLLIAAMDGRTFDSVLCFHPDRTPSAGFGRQAAAAVAVFAAVGFLFAAPGVLGTFAMQRSPTRSATAHIWSLCLNTAALVLLYLGLRTTVGITRTSLTVGWAGWTLVLSILACRQDLARIDLSRQIRERWPVAAISLAFVLASAGLFFSEQFVQCFNEDGTEAHELARSLRQSALPAWEIETGDLQGEVDYGPVVVNPSLVNSYWTSAVQTVLGDGELAARLPYWVWWLAICLMCCRLIGLVRGEAVDWIDAGLVGLLAVLVSVLFTFYVGYNPYMADLANPGVTNALFTLCFLAMLECLFHRDRAGFAAAVLLGSLVFYSGVVMLVLILAAAWIWQPISRREVWRWGKLSALMLFLVGAGYILYGAAEGVLRLWFDALDIEYLNDYLAPVPRGSSALLFLGYFVLGSGGAAVVGLIRAFWQGPWQRTVATATIGYLAIVLMSGFKNLHYLGPLFPIPLLLLLASQPGGRWKVRLLLAGSLLICLGLSWPAEREAFVLNRQFGEQTTFATDSYPEAVLWARLRYGLQDGNVLSWDCDQHTWVAYAQLDRKASDPRPLLVTVLPPSGEYQLLAIGFPSGAPRSVGLYTRDPDLPSWLSTQNPLRPLDRYPLVFRPLAEGPFSPHNNQLEDVRRLRPDR